MLVAPKITVITVVLNKQQEVERTIHSVLTQRYPHLEYVVIDGGSTDGTVDIIKTYQQYIDHWISEPDNGIYDAMNKGIQCASGELLVFLNGGDAFLEKESLQWVADTYLTQHQPDVIFGGTCIRYEQYKTDVPFHPAFSKKSLDHGIVPPQSATFVKKSVFTQIGAFDLTYSVCADFEFICRVFFSHLTFYRLDRTLTVFYSGGISSNKQITYKELYTIIKNFFGPYPAYLFKIRKIMIEQEVKKLLQAMHLLEFYYERFYFVDKTGR